MKKSKIICTVIAVILCLMPFQASAENHTVPMTRRSEIEDEKVYCQDLSSNNYVPCEVIVSIKKNYSTINQVFTANSFPGVDIVKIDDLTEKPNSEKQGLFDENAFRQILLLTISSDQSVRDAIHKLEENPIVHYAAPNWISETTQEETQLERTIHIKLENDRSINALNPSTSKQYAHGLINTPGAWNYSTGSQDTLVGIMGAGIDTAHPYISSNVALQLCQNFTNDGQSDYSYSDNYGTEMAGIIGGKYISASNISGICPTVSLISLKVIKKTGNIYTRTISWAINAINYAQNEEIPILCCTSEFANLNDENLSSAIESYSGLFVCPAGDSATDIDSTPYYPACFSSNRIIAVMSTDADDLQTATTNYGVSRVLLSAPGELIYTSTQNSAGTKTYAYRSGSMYAAAMVAGVAALLKSYDPSLTAGQIKTVITNSVDTVSALSGKCSTGGRLNANKAFLQVRRLKNYLVEVNVAANSGFTTLACWVYFNTDKLYGAGGEFGPVAANNTIPLYYNESGVGFNRYPNTTPLTTGGVLYRAKLSMPSTLTMLASDYELHKVTPATTSLLTMSRYLMGDINNDGSINSSDSLLALQAGTGSTTLTNAQKKRGDVNFDGAVNSTDASLISNYSVYLLRSFW